MIMVAGKNPMVQATNWKLLKDNIPFLRENHYNTKTLTRQTIEGEEVVTCDLILPITVGVKLNKTNDIVILSKTRNLVALESDSVLITMLLLSELCHEQEKQIAVNKVITQRNFSTQILLSTFCFAVGSLISFLLMWGIYD